MIIVTMMIITMIMIMIKLLLLILIVNNTVKKIENTKIIHFIQVTNITTSHNNNET